MKKLFIVLVLSAFTVPLISQDRTSLFDQAKMRDRVRTLADDRFEGRGPGTKGGAMAAKYIADQMRSSGVLPGNRGSYFQNVPLIGVKADPNTRLIANITKGPSTKYFKFGDDFVATTGAQTADVAVNAEVVFVGYGIDAPLYRWNDYKGNPNQYKGKVLMILVNDPPATSAEPDLFGGKALTYYGRWTYKYEEAARKGASGVILVHTTESAGYGWNVVRTSNGNWRYEIARTRADKTPFLKVRSWMTEDAAESLLDIGDTDLDDLRKQARSRDFKPVNTGVTVSLNLKSETKRFNSPNVVGMVQGSDPRLSDEYVVYSAHWDHLGMGEASPDGDNIYNGAYDNASGVSAVLGIAEVLAKMPRRQRPKRSFLFFFPTAEEQGLLGAEYYSRFPIVPLNKTTADLNIDGVNFFGKVSDFVPLGADRSSIIEQINDAARERGLTIRGDSQPEQGYFFRSDHFPFAKVGIPAVNFQHGDNFTPALKGKAEEFFKEYRAKYYHQTSDEYHEWWDTSAMVQEAEFALAFGIKIANLEDRPRYKDTDEFAAADKKRFKK